MSFDLNVSYSSCWGFSLINTLKLKKKKHASSSDQRAQRFHIWPHHQLQTDKKETMNKLGIGWPCCCPSADATASQCVQFGQIVRGMDSYFLHFQYPQAMAAIQTTSKRTASLSAAPSNVLSSQKVLYHISVNLVFTARINSLEQYNKPMLCMMMWCKGLSPYVVNIFSRGAVSVVDR